MDNFTILTVVELMLSMIFSPVYFSMRIPTFSTNTDAWPSLLSTLKLDKLQNLKFDKSPGPDGWHSIILKNCADQLCAPLAILYNKSLESGVLPHDWKIGHIVPIFRREAKLKLTIITLSV